MNNSNNSGNSVYSLPKGKVFSGYEAESMYTNLYGGQENSFIKDPVNILVDTNITLPHYTGTDNTRLLLISQTNGIENGIYTIQNNTLSRSSDMSIGIHVTGSLIYAYSNSTYYTCTCNYNQDVVGINDLIFSVIYLTPYNILGTGSTSPVGSNNYIQFYQSDPSNHVNSSAYFNDNNNQFITNYRLLTGYKLILGKPSATTIITSDENFHIEGNTILNILTGLSGNGSGSGDIIITSTDLDITTNTCNITCSGANINSDTLVLSTNDYINSASNVTNTININGIDFYKGMLLTKTNQTIPVVQTITSTSYQGQFIIQDVTSLGPSDSVIIRVNNSNISSGNQLIFVNARQTSETSNIGGIPIAEIYNVQNGYYEIMLTNVGDSSLPSNQLVIEYFMIKTL